MSASTSIPAVSPEIAGQAEAHFLDHLSMIWQRTDRLLAGLLLTEWIGGIALASLLSPHAWQGNRSTIHPHVIAAVFLGLAIVSLPVAMAVLIPGQTLTRHTVAVAQMLMSALLIHLGDGRIEMHFHIFGSLAFIAFYRDWRVLITATAVVAVDHLIRGIYLPASIYGVMSATMWRTLEHAWWVVFEDIFLVVSCVQGVNEIHGIALNRALLEASHADVELKVAQRTADLKTAQEELMKAARTAGMAEIATSVLHNVGNVLNSVNVSATIVSEKLRQSEVVSLTRVGQMMADHESDLPQFLSLDERGKMIPGFITDLAVCLGEEQTAMQAELTSLSSGIEHIKRIVAAQQSMAKASRFTTAARPGKLLESAVSIASHSSSSTAEIDIRADDCPEVLIDQHKVLQILINLLSNARHAVMYRPEQQRRVSVSVGRIESGNGEVLRFQVTDNGSGVAPENLAKIFSHGFTTKKEGHGYGLHSAANAAREMQGSLSVASDGPGKGATFTLDVPLVLVEQGAACQN